MYAAHIPGIRLHVREHVAIIQLSLCIPHDTRKVKYCNYRVQHKVSIALSGIKIRTEEGTLCPCSLLTDQDK